MTWNVLKWVAIAAMFIDHTAAVLGGLFAAGKKKGKRRAM